MQTSLHLSIISGTHSIERYKITPNQFEKFSDLRSMYVPSLSLFPSPHSTESLSNECVAPSSVVPSDRQPFDHVDSKRILCTPRENAQSRLLERIRYFFFE